MKRIALFVAVALVTAACGDGGMLDGLGDRSKVLVHGETSTTTTTVEPIREETPQQPARWCKRSAAAFHVTAPFNACSEEYSRGR